MGVVYWIGRYYMLNQFCRAKKHVDKFFEMESIKIDEAATECNEFREVMKAYAFVEFRHYSKKGFIITYDKYLTFVEENERWIKEKYSKWYTGSLSFSKR
jgi:predicted GNAT superfamily acetyltransferase